MSSVAIEVNPSVRQVDVSELNIRRLSLEEYHRLVEIGFFVEDEPIDLIEGLLHLRTSKPPRHAACRSRLLHLVVEKLGERARVGVQDPITMPSSDSEPEPDLMLIVPREGGYFDRHPLPEEALLVVEISDGLSLDVDQGVKLRVYAAAGIEEYWVINLVDDQVEVYREPATLPDGTATYDQHTVHRVGDIIAPLHFPDCAIEVAPLLP